MVTPDEQVSWSSHGEVAPVQWFVFFSEKHQREYFYEPKSETVTWVMPDNMHPYPSVKHQSSTSIDEQEPPSTKRVAFYDPVSTESSPPRQIALLLKEDSVDTPFKKPARLPRSFAMLVGLTVIVSLVATLNFRPANVSHWKLISSRSWERDDGGSNFGASPVSKSSGREQSIEGSGIQGIVGDDVGASMVMEPDTQKPQDVQSKATTAGPKRRCFIPFALVFSRSCRQVARNGGLFDLEDFLDHSI